MCVSCASVTVSNTCIPVRARSLIQLKDKTMLELEKEWKVVLPPAIEGQDKEDRLLEIAGINHHFLHKPAFTWLTEQQCWNVPDDFSLQMHFLQIMQKKIQILMYFSHFQKSHLITNHAANAEVFVCSYSFPYRNQQSHFCLHFPRLFVWVFIVQKRK